MTARPTRTPQMTLARGDAGRVPSLPGVCFPPIAAAQLTSGQRRIRSPAVDIAIVADTHLPRGSRRIPETCWERMAGADLIVHAGDFTALEVIYDLEALGPPVAAVHGNVDDP